jgi:preprotein translocase subunit SecG
MLAFLVVIFVAMQIACGVIVAMQNKHISAGKIRWVDSRREHTRLMRQISEEFILSGTHMCGYLEGDTVSLSLMTWVSSTAWAVLALCLAVWIAVKHLQRPSTPAGWAFFTAVIKTHVFYFAR